MIESQARGTMSPGTHAHHPLPHFAHHVIVSPVRGECIGNEACEMWTAHDGHAPNPCTYAHSHDACDRRTIGGERLSDTQCEHIAVGRQCPALAVVEGKILELRAPLVAMSRFPLATVLREGLVAIGVKDMGAQDEGDRAVR